MILTLLYTVKSISLVLLIFVAVSPNSPTASFIGVLPNFAFKPQAKITLSFWFLYEKWTSCHLSEHIVFRSNQNQKHYKDNSNITFSKAAFQTNIYTT
jgi:hypothetical protein